MTMRKGRRASPKSEPIDLRARRFGYFPRTFVWRGHEYTVKAVERCQTVGDRRSRIARNYFTVRCAEGRCTLYQDLHAHTWHIELKSQTLTVAPAAKTASR